VTGVGGVPTTGVSAVVLNATVPAPALTGYLQVYPLGAKPAIATSNVNWRPGRNQANAVTVAVGTGGKIGLMVAVGKADVTLDVVGWYGDATDPAGDYYHPSIPARILDTRTSGGGGPVTGSKERTLVVAGHGGVPAAGVSSVVMTLTAVNATAPAYVEVYPTGARSSRPTSNTDVVPGQVVAALVISPLGSNGSVQLLVNKGSADLVADVLGYYSSAGSRYVPLAPRRVLDTRSAHAPVASSSDRSVPITGLNGVPTSATGVVVNTTGVNASQPLNLEVYPTGSKPSPRTSVLNQQDAMSVADLVMMPLGGGAISLSASNGHTDVVLDVMGYLTP